MSVKAAANLLPPLQKAGSASKTPLADHIVSLLPSNYSAISNQNESMIQVYLRSSSKKSFKIDIPAKVSVPEIKSIVEYKFGLNRERQLLYLNGKDITQNAWLQLQPLSIIHIANRDSLLKQQDESYAKIIIINSFTQNSKDEKNVIIRASQTVNDFLSHIQQETQAICSIECEKAHYFLLESGRLLEREKSFYEQNIAEDTEMICLITKREVKTRFLSDKTQNNADHIIDQLESTSKISNKIEDKCPQITQITLNSPNCVKQADRERELLEQASITNFLQSQKTVIRPSQEYQEEQLFNADKTDLKNFKKKTNPTSHSIISQFQRPLAIKLKSSKTKKQVEQMLRSEGKNNIFLCSDAIIRKRSAIKGSYKQISQEDTIYHKPTASIPKLMPVKQRKKIKLEMEKLFETGGISKTVSEASSIKEEESPKSPPTQIPPRLQKRKEKMKNLRIPMGSRPDFTNGMRSPKNQVP